MATSIGCKEEHGPGGGGGGSAAAAATGAPGQRQVCGIRLK